MTKNWRIKKDYLSADGCFYEGGGAAQGSENEPENQPPQEAPTSWAAGEMDAYPDNQPAIAPATSLTPISQQQPVGAPVMPAQPQQAPLANPTMSGVGQQIAGIRNEATAQGKIANTQADLYEKDAARQQEMLMTYGQDLEKHQAQVDGMVKAIQDNQIDPDRYMHSKSNSGKVATAIGLLLGGISQGMTGAKSNPVMDFLQKQIDHDVEAQKANLNGKENILAHFEKQFGNKQQALQMTNAVMTQQMAAKINQAALASGDALAKARAQQMIGALQQQAQGSIDAASRESTINKAIASGQDIAAISPYMDDKQRARAVPGLGLALDPGAAKKMNDEVIPAYQGAKQGIKELNDFGIMDKFSPTARAKAEAIQTRVIGQLRMVLLGPGTISDSERKLVKNVVANPTELFSIANTDKLQILNGALDKDYAARVKQSGLALPQQQMQQSSGVRFKPSK